MRHVPLPRCIGLGLLAISAASAAEPAAPPAWSLTQHGAHVLAVARRGGVWYVATQEKGLWQIRGATWEAVSLPVQDTVHALAVDRRGRLWAGHGHSGVSVFDGTDWKNYDGVAGPLGHRVFAVTVSPLDGDVWLATDSGLARYADKADTWSYFNRAVGLPADQASAIAFDAGGTIYVGTQCEGLAIARPGDGYATWSLVTGPSREPVDATGPGLPSPLVNDVLVTGTGDVYVATDAGLAISTDAGKTFSFVRGLDFLEKARQRSEGPPGNWTPGAPQLAEDHVAALAEDGHHRVLIGYGRSGVDVYAPGVAPDARPLTKSTGGDTPVTGPALDAVRTIRVLGGRAVVGGFGGGLAVDEFDAADLPDAPLPARPPAMPSAAKPNAAAIDALAVAARDTKRDPVAAAFLGDDWVTRGDGVGRYGCQKMLFPFYGEGGSATGYALSLVVGPHGGGGRPTYYFDNTHSDEDRVLYVPNAFKRLSGEFNDGAYDATRFPFAFEGPDLWLTVEVPAGVHRLGLYFLNFDGLDDSNRFRDFLIEVKPFSESLADADSTPALARARVNDFVDGVYKQFLLTEGKYRVKIGRNHSFATKIAGVFLDRLDRGATSDADRQPTGLLDPAHWGPPAADRPADAGGPLKSAFALWDATDPAAAGVAALATALPLRAQAYALAEQSGASELLLANWRWHLHAWTPADRLEFCRQMDAGYQRALADGNANAAQPRKGMEETYAAAHP